MKKDIHIFFGYKTYPPALGKTYNRLRDGQHTHLGKITETVDADIDIASLRAKATRIVKAQPAFQDFLKSHLNDYNKAKYAYDYNTDKQRAAAFLWNNVNRGDGWKDWLPVVDVEKQPGYHVTTRWADIVRREWQSFMSASGYKQKAATTDDITVYYGVIFQKSLQ